MPRLRPTVGPVRSVRLPLALDEWLQTRFAAHPHRSPSELLVETVHGGLRLRDGYMSIHRAALERLASDATAYLTYRRCLLDTFGTPYVVHLERWLHADGLAFPAAEMSTA